MCVSGYGLGHGAAAIGTPSWDLHQCVCVLSHIIISEKGVSFHGQSALTATVIYRCRCAHVFGGSLVDLAHPFNKAVTLTSLLEL